jgi:hypothetical protein
MRTAAKIILAGLLLNAMPALAQEKKEGGNRAVYKIEFNIRDGSPAAANAGRRYSMLIESDGRGVFRLGNKVPYITGGTQSGPSAALVNRQYNYADIGVNIDCRVHELNNRVSMNANIELSSVLHNDKGASASEPNPTIASSRIEVATELDPGKPIVIATVDDPVTQRRLEIEATVSKLN